MSRATNNVATMMEARTRPVLDLIDDLRKIGIDEDVPIPQIVVVGDQSSGKSSVLEAISGVSFPRGSGLVTRVATQLTMSCGDTWSATITAGATRRQLDEDHKEDISKTIEELTEKLAPGSTFCADEIIEIQLVAPDAPDLTIIDLPGIVRTVTGNQDRSIIEQVDSLIDKYIAQKRTIILCVIASNVDIATNDVLERAAKVDPDGNRTMGVLTKPDLVDKGGEGEIVGVLSNQSKPLRHGYVMVKNRGQEDLQNGMSMDEHRRSEQAFFASSPYNKPGHRFGVDALSTALTELLVEQIETALPSMKAEVQQALDRTEEALGSLPKPPPDSARSRRTTTSNMVREWSSSLRKVSEADYREVEGKDAKYFLLQTERSERKTFVKSVEHSRPGFDGQQDEVTIEVTETGNRQDLDDGVVHREVGDTLPDSEGLQSITRIGQTFYWTYSKSGFTKGKVVELTKYFRGDLVELIEQQRGRELPGFMSFGIFSTLMAGYTKLWIEPTEVFRAHASEALFTAAAAFVEDGMGTIAPFMQQKTIADLRTHIEVLDQVAKKRLEHLQKGELLPSTENAYLQETISKVRADRIVRMVKELPNSDGPKSVSRQSVVDMLKSRVGNTGDDSQEVQDMIDMLSSYWQLSMKRYCDEVGIVITDVYTSLPALAGLERMISDALLIDCDDEQLKQLFRQNTHVERQRIELEATRTRLACAKDRIEQGIVAPQIRP
eukprot:gene22546-20645_t